MYDCYRGIVGLEDSAPKNNILYYIEFYYQMSHCRIL